MQNWGVAMSSRTSRARAYRRTVAMGTASLLLVVLGLSPARSATAAGPTAEPFSNGMAKATGVVVRLAPGVGSLELALGNGIAVAELKNSLTQAQAQAADLGLIGTTLTAEGCSDAVLTPDQLPQSTRVDNRHGPAAATTDFIPIAGETLGGGRGTVDADATSAHAVAMSASSITPALVVDGGKAAATVEVVDGAARQAYSEVEASLTIGGALELDGMHWEALHRTGKDPIATATFDIGTARLFGVPIPLESLEAAEAAINTVLAPTGISLRFPRVERFTEPTDLIRMTPMLILLKDSAAGKAALGPGLNLTREQRFNLFNQLAGAICQAAGALLVGDIGLSILSGTGFMGLEIGGAEAISGDLILEDPFGPPVAPPSATPPAVVPEVVVPPAIAPTAPPSAVATPTAPRPAASIGPLEELCETIHPHRSPSCSRGSIAWLGLLGLGATAAVAGLDYRHQRRRAALVPSAEAGA